MEKTKQREGVIILLLLVGSLFYWFEWRPSNIGNECTAYVLESKLSLTNEVERSSLNWYMNKINKVEQDRSDFVYEDCLNSKGLGRYTYMDGSAIIYL